MNKLIDYIISITNSFDLDHKDKVVEIYNMQKKEHITIENVSKLLNNLVEYLENNFVFAQDDYFVYEVIKHKGTVLCAVI